MPVPIKDQPNHNSNGFAQRPHDAGKPKGHISIKQNFIKALEQGGSVIRVPIEKAKLIKTEKGEFYELQVGTMEAIVYRFVNIAVNGKAADSVAAIKFLTEMIDGKAKQQIEHSGETNITFDPSKLPDDALDALINVINPIE